MSKYLSLAAGLAAKAATITEAQKKEIENLEKKIEGLNSTLAIAIEAISRDVQAKKLTVAQGECEEAIAKAHTKAAIEECEAKIREINPTWSSNVSEQAKLAAQATAVKGLELIGKGLGFLGRVVETSKAAAQQSNIGAFQAPKKISMLDVLQNKAE